MKIKESGSNLFGVLTGAIFMTIAVFIALSLFSYSPQDPSLNNITDSTTKNLLWEPGAYTADLLLQLFGFASLFIILILASWSIHKLFSIEIKHLWVRFIFSLFSLCIGSLLLSKYIQNSEVPFASYGGAIGNVLSIYTISYSNEYLLYGLITAFVVTSYFALGISMKSWIFFVNYTSKHIMRAIISTKYIAQSIASASRYLYRLFKPKDDIEFESIDNAPEIPELNLQPEPARKEAFKPSQPKKPAFNFGLSKTNKYKLPSSDFLNVFKKFKSSYSDAELRSKAADLIKVLNDFGVRGEITSCSPGPVVTLFEFEPVAGTKSSRVIGLADDIARTMKAVSTRIAVIPGKNSLGIELPNKTREVVYIRGVVESSDYKDNACKLPLILGKDIGGENIIADLSTMPHLLVAGTTGSGKSVAINTMILSILYKYTPEECKLVMIDPKMLELSVYQNIPHLLAPVVTESSKAVNALKWVVKEMENRYKMISHLKVRNIGSYNEKIEEAIEKNIDLSKSVQTGLDPETKEPIFETIEIAKEKLPYIVVVVDEMADLMVVAGKEIESSIQRLAQMARAAGIHLIMATQRPSVDVITGVIKANFPTRISFQVISKIDSRTILGEPGAEQLLGKGDMLYMSGGNRIKRVHGPFVDDKEVEKVVAFWKEQGSPTYSEDITVEKESGGDSYSADEQDDLYDQALDLIKRERRVSTSYLQRYFKIGYNRAATIIEQLEKNSVIGAPNHVGKREILINE
ncbi:MAG: DNA translocase FtsK 4TM domain-containing protein [Alphaproteobacteria bacterium]|nr:DNA translocase FtsK 4TM domain-containing protein [Alphaproteobacteria bacterium]